MFENITILNAGTHASPIMIKSGFSRHSPLTTASPQSPICPSGLLAIADQPFLLQLLLDLWKVEIHGLHHGRAADRCAADRVDLVDRLVVVLVDGDPEVPLGEAEPAFGLRRRQELPGVLDRPVEPGDDSSAGRPPRYFGCSFSAAELMQ